MHRNIDIDRVAMFVFCLAFGLCDLGMGSPELGSVRISEMEAVRGPGGLAIERDIHFVSTKTISAYAAEARQLGRINA
jgi:hypothetical protein